MLQRAVAKNLVYDTADVIKLLCKHGIKVQDSITYKELLKMLFSSIKENAQFAKDYSNLLIQRKRITNYNDHRNLIGIGAAIIGGLSTVAGGLFRSSQQNKANDLARDQMEASNTQTVMNMMMQEEANKVQMTKQENLLIISAVGAMVIITGIIILSRNKK